MLGLGIGSLTGGALSRVVPRAALPLFAGFELAIGLFGLFSLEIFARVANVTAGVGHLLGGERATPTPTAAPARTTRSR